VAGADLRIFGLGLTVTGYVCDVIRHQRVRTNKCKATRLKYASFAVDLVW
jgi:hypothetical protein